MTESEKVKQHVEQIIVPPTGLTLNLKELWEYRELFYFFAWRDIKVKYKQTVLGFLWVIIQPLMMVLIFTFFLGKRLNMSITEIPYPLFVVSGLLLWNVFSGGVIGATNSMLNNSAVIKKIYFPRLIIPISSVLVVLFDFFILFILFVIISVIFFPSLNFGLLLISWPVAILLTLSTTIGASAWLSALTVKYRDFRYVVPFAIQILLFVSPILYPVSFSKTWVNYLFALNPINAAISIFRLPFGYDVTPDLLMLAMGMAISLIILFMGLFYFKKTEMYFADIS